MSCYISSGFKAAFQLMSTELIATLANLLRSHTIPQYPSALHGESFTISQSFILPLGGTRPKEERKTRRSPAAASRRHRPSAAVARQKISYRPTKITFAAKGNRLIRGRNVVAIALALVVGKGETQLPWPFCAARGWDCGVVFFGAEFAIRLVCNCPTIHDGSFMMQVIFTFPTFPTFSSCYVEVFPVRVFPG